MNVRLYLLQRATALVMVPLIIGHLAIIFYATRQGLTAADILGRTRGSLGWGVYYAAFVLAASVHGAIGVRGSGPEEPANGNESEDGYCCDCRHLHKLRR